MRIALTSLKNDACTPAFQFRVLARNPELDSAAAGHCGPMKHDTYWTPDIIRCAEIISDQVSSIALGTAN